MALYGVLGDIHGNREALAAVLALLDRRGAERLLCVGDVVGYNADPDECVAMLRARPVVCIAGNHDLIALRRLGLGRCSDIAAYALRRTRRTLGREAAGWLATLPPTALVEDAIALVHGGVRDVQQYMTTPEHIRQNAALLRDDMPSARVCFFGHSHRQKVYEIDGTAIFEHEGDEAILKKGCAYFINAGSVDAARKRGEKLAECALLDTERGTVKMLRTPYDAASAEAKAAALGYRLTPAMRALYSARGLAPEVKRGLGRLRRLLGLKPVSHYASRLRR